MTDHQSYRGYEITVEPNGEGWRVWAHPMTPDLPVTKHRSFHLDAGNTEEALAEARKRIDDLLIV
jgi:hypothetical protein